MHRAPGVALEPGDGLRHLQRELTDSVAPVSAMISGSSSSVRASTTSPSLASRFARSSGDVRPPGRQRVRAAWRRLRRRRPCASGASPDDLLGGRVDDPVGARRPGDPLTADVVAVLGGGRGHADTAKVPGTRI